LAKPNTFGNVDQLSLAAATVVFKLQIATSRQSLLENHFVAGAAPSGFMISPRKVFFQTQCSQKVNFYRAMLSIRGTSHGPVSVCPSVCPSQVGVLLKRMNESSWFLAYELTSTRPTLC